MSELSTTQANMRQAYAEFERRLAERSAASS